MKPIRSLWIMIFFAVLIGATAMAQTEQEAQPMSAAQVFLRLEKENAARASELRSYTSVRHYAVLEVNHPPDAETIVNVQFNAPSTKNFKVVSEKGVGWIHKRVFKGLMQAEQEATSGKKNHNSSISSANYTAKLIGEEAIHGRDTYVLELEPKRNDKFLMRGKIWVDKEEFAIVRLEGEPVKNPSFWVTRAHLTREYQKIGQFWLQLSDETLCKIRFVGEYILRIKYSDYKINVSDAKGK